MFSTVFVARSMPLRTASSKLSDEAEVSSMTFAIAMTESPVALHVRREQVPCQGGVGRGSAPRMARSLHDAAGLSYEGRSGKKPIEQRGGLTCGVASRGARARRGAGGGTRDQRLRPVSLGLLSRVRQRRVSARRRHGGESPARDVLVLDSEVGHSTRPELRSAAAAADLGGGAESRPRGSSAWT